jgi:hypothetical protein
VLSNLIFYATFACDRFVWWFIHLLNAIQAVQSTIAPSSLPSAVDADPMLLAVKKEVCHVVCYKENLT